MTCVISVRDLFPKFYYFIVQALSFDVFYITMHSPFGFVDCPDEKISGRVHWFLSFALQQNHIQSLTSNYKLVFVTITFVFTTHLLFFDLGEIKLVWIEWLGNT